MLACLGLSSSSRAAPGWRPPELEVKDPPPITDAEGLLDIALSYLGRPYTFGGVGSPGFDCSGFVCRVYAEAGWGLPRVSRDQARAGRPVERKDLLPGDLLFFAEEGEPISHVGIYLGDDHLVHASSGKGEVALAELSWSWFSSRFVGARRVLTSTPTVDAVPDALVTELEEHRGRTALSPFLTRAPRFLDPPLGFAPPEVEGTGVGGAVLLSTEDERWGLVVAPELAFVHRPWALEALVAVPVRFEADADPTVGEVESFRDVTRWLRRLRVGLPGAQLEAGLEQVVSLSLLDLSFLSELSPIQRTRGLPGATVGRVPLSFVSAVRGKLGAVEALVDDVALPRLFGLGARWDALPWLSVSAGGGLHAHELGTRKDRSPLWTSAIAVTAAWAKGRAYRVALTLEGDLAGLGYAEERALGAGGRAELSTRVGLGPSRRDTLGLDLFAGVAGEGFIFEPFGPTYAARPEDTMAAFLLADAPRAEVGGQLVSTLGKLSLRAGYAQALGPRRLAFDRRWSGVLELKELSLNGPRVLDVRLAYAGRAPFASPSAETGAGPVHTLSASLRLRLASWLHASASAQLGETWSAGAGLGVTWVP